ncbi:MAG: hypothetical protein PUI48_04910 [Oscillospiraceae bacterium]|nr:hypothetical protein [Oscillospiraceae bacterium]MDY6207497.1 hypothetical protein [Oscillospiraceae bacterium]
MDITKFYEMRKRLYAFAASDGAMLEESRKFTDKLILQFQNKPKGELK